MNMYTFFLALLISNTIFFTSSCHKASNTNRGSIDFKNDKCDTITKNDFFRIAREVKQKMDNHDIFTTEKSITMVKVYNTIHQTFIANDIERESFIADYKKIFLKEYLAQINRQLECSYGKGMTVYSKKYDLYVGVGSSFRCSDIYTVIN